MTLRIILRGDEQAKYFAGEMTETLRLAQHAIDRADGDPTKGNLIVASPLA